MVMVEESFPRMCICTQKPINKLKIQTTGIHGFSVEKIIERLEPWEKAAPTRRGVANICKDLFPESFIYVGGHHVAVHNPITEERMLLITGKSPDFN